MTSPRSITPPGVDYSKKWFVQVAIAMGIFLGTIDGSIVNVALPTLVREFDTTFGVVQWVVLGYLLTLATLTLAIGRLGDMIGKKRIYTVGFGVFTVGSVLAGLAPSVLLLILARVFQALGAAMIFSLGLAIITEAFPPHERGKALGINGTIVSVGIVLGPTLGGLLIDSLGWRWIFFVNLPVGIIGTLTAMRFVPNVPPPGAERFDWPGAFAFFVTLLSLLTGLTFGQDRGFTDPLILGLVLVAVVAGAVFVAIERRSRHPMLDLTIFQNRLLSVNLVTGLVSFIAIAGLLILLPFYLENVLGYPPRTVGLLLAAAPVSLGIAAPISGTISDRIGPRPVTVAGLAILVVAYSLVLTLNESTTVLHYVLVGVPLGLGMGIFQSPNNSAVMGSVPPHRLGVTSGMLAITRIAGQIIGISVLGTIWAARVVARSGGGVAATEASARHQVGALHDTFALVMVLVAAALALAVWGWRLERRDNAVAAVGDASPSR